MLQFLKQSREALQNCDAALGIYREVGARLGEANTLLELGRLQEDDHQALARYQVAQEIYRQIGDRYSQARNLFATYFCIFLMLCWRWDRFRTRSRL